jgi:Glutaminase
MTDSAIIPTLFEYQLSDITDSSKTVSKQLAEAMMVFFATHPLFKWADINNGCEARADAVCLLLQQWGIPNYKAWVFSGRYLKKHVGGLKQNWNYHVAPMLQVMEDGQLIQYIIDPATSGSLQTFYNWAANITEFAHSYQLVKEAHWYIFPGKKITGNNWNTRNRQNQKWMIQGLAGVNGLNAKGRAQLVFNKARIKKIKIAFEKLKRESPVENSTVFIKELQDSGKYILPTTLNKHRVAHRWRLEEE